MPKGQLMCRPAEGVEGSMRLGGSVRHGNTPSGPEREFPRTGRKASHQRTGRHRCRRGLALDDIVDPGACARQIESGYGDAAFSDQGRSIVRCRHDDIAGLASNRRGASGRISYLRVPLRFSVIRLPMVRVVQQRNGRSGTNSPVPNPGAISPLYQGSWTNPERPA